MNPETYQAPGGNMLYHCTVAMVIPNGDGPNEYVIRSPWTGKEIALPRIKGLVHNETDGVMIVGMMNQIYIAAQDAYFAAHGEIDSGFDELPGRKEGKTWFSYAGLCRWARTQR